MKARIGFACGIAAALVLVGAVALDATAQEKKVAFGAKEETPLTEEQMAMQKMMELATPGEHHKHLAALAGKWNVTVKSWMPPDAPPQTSNGSSTVDWVLGGRFLKENFKGDFMGQPFEGLGLVGFDNGENKYTSVWMDSMGTMMMTMDGGCAKKGKVLTMKGSYLDPMTGKKKTMKGVTTIQNDNKHVFEGFELGPDGKEVRTMEITYTRM